jgi:ribulose-5-phosphate 4-epimerase/fuculose-1-phosphate aldolase
MSGSEPRRQAADRLAVFFVTHISRPLTATELARVLAPLGRPLVRRVLDNVRVLRRRHPDLAVVSIRELLAGTEAALRSQVRARFDSLRWLTPFRRPAAGPAAAAYAGPYPAVLQPADARWLFSRMAEMQTVAADVLRTGLAVSSSHIVISARRGRFLAITATDTDKSEVRLYSHTPLVTLAGKRLRYYGDRAHPPSSETLSHWYLHRALARLDPGAAACLLHFHHVGLREAAQAGTDLNLGQWRIPCVAPRAYGSREQGLAMATAMHRARSRAVTVAAHGTWFAGNSLPTAYRLARRLARLFSLTPLPGRC